MHALRDEDELASATAAQAVTLDPDSLSGHALLGESYTFREPRDLAKAEHRARKTLERRHRRAAVHSRLNDSPS